MLESSGDPFRMILMFIFQVLAWVVMLSSHFLKVARSSNACPLFYERPSASLLGYLDRGELVWKEMELVPSTTS